MTPAITTTTRELTTTLIGTEDFIVGISPTYWSHVKLCITQIHNLDYINGINYLVIVQQQQKQRQLEDHDDEEDYEVIPKKYQKAMIPISKCCLQGCLVGIENKGGGCYSLIVDDGTGLIDVLYYDNQSSSYDNEYSLPSLIDDPLLVRFGINNNNNNNKYYNTKNNEGEHGANTINKLCNNSWIEIGTFVQVFGRINCWNVGMNDTNNGSVVREIIATIVLPIPTSSRSCPYSIDAESDFWSQWRQSMQQEVCNNQCTNISSHDVSKRIIIPKSIGLTNSITTLQWLGPDITTQVMKRQHLPAIDDSIGEWKLFGTNCTCGGNNTTTNRRRHRHNHPVSSNTTEFDGKQLSTNTARAIIKEKLLYCHCIATPEINDPNFTFRDKLLIKLITMENQFNNTCENEQSNDRVHDDDDNKNDEDEFLRFHYKDDIMDDDNLQSIAAQQVVNTGITPSKRLIEKVMTNTMVALRRDGIVVLLDSQADVYGLISYHNVVLPYVRMIRYLEYGNFDNYNDDDVDKMNTNNGDSTIQKLLRPLERVLYSKEYLPTLLAQVPTARFELVERYLLQELKEKKLEAKLITES